MKNININRATCNAYFMVLVLIMLMILTLSPYATLGNNHIGYTQALGSITSFTGRHFKNNHIIVKIENSEDEIFTRFGKLVSLHGIEIQVYDNIKGVWKKAPWSKPLKIVRIYDKGSLHFVVKRGIAGDLVEVAMVYMASKSSLKSKPLKIAIVIRGLKNKDINVRIVWKFKLTSILIHKLRLFSPTLHKLAAITKGKKVSMYKDLMLSEILKGNLSSIKGIAKVVGTKILVMPEKAKIYPAIQLFDRKGELLMGFNYQDIAFDLKKFIIDLKTRTIKIVFGDYVVNRSKVMVIDPYLDGGGGGKTYASYPVYDTGYIYDFAGNIIAIIGVSVYGPPTGASKEAVVQWGTITTMKVGCGAGFVEGYNVRDVFSVGIEVGWRVLYDETTGTIYRYGDLTQILHFMLRHDDLQKASSIDYLTPIGSVILKIIKGIAEKLGISSVLIPEPFTFAQVEQKPLENYDRISVKHSGYCIASAIGLIHCKSLRTHGGGQLYSVAIIYPESFSPNHHAYLEMYAKANMCVVQHLVDDIVYCGSKTIYWWVYLRP